MMFENLDDYLENFTFGKELDFTETIKESMCEYFYRSENYTTKRKQYEYLGKCLGVDGEYVRKMINFQFKITSTDYLIALCLLLNIEPSKAHDLIDSYIKEAFDKWSDFNLSFNPSNNYSSSDPRDYILIKNLEYFYKKKDYYFESGDKLLLLFNNKLIAEGYCKLDVKSTKKKNIIDRAPNEIRRFFNVRHEEDFIPSNQALGNKYDFNNIISAYIDYRRKNGEYFRVVSSKKGFFSNYTHQWFRYDKQGRKIDDFLSHESVKEEYKDNWYKYNIEMCDKIYPYVDAYLDSVCDKIKQVYCDTKNFVNRIGARFKDNCCHIFYEEFNYDFVERQEYYYMDLLHNKYTFKVSNISSFMSDFNHNFEKNSIYNRNEITIVFDSFDDIDLKLKGNFNYERRQNIKTAYLRIKELIDKTKIDIIEGKKNVYDSMDMSDELIEEFSNSDELYVVNKSGKEIHKNDIDLKRAFELGINNEEDLKEYFKEKESLEDIFD